VLKLCRVCGATGRALAGFCHVCGDELPPTQYDWPTFKGGEQRLGLDEIRLAKGFRQLQATEVLHLTLGERCHSLLSWDRHLIAIGRNGTVKIVEPSSRETIGTMTADGPLTCEPSIDRGVLFLACADRIAAYALGGLTLTSPRLDPLWQASISGVPTQALLTRGNRLFVNTQTTSGKRSVQMLEDVHRLIRPQVRELLSAERVSTLAAGPKKNEVILVMERAKALEVQLLDASAATPTFESHRVPSPILPLIEHVPIAVLGTRVFGVFGEDDQLCRIDLDANAVMTILRADAQAFSFNRYGQWIQVETFGIAFPHLEIRDELTPGERIRGEPVVFFDSTAAVGLHDGRILVYDITRPPYHEELRVSPEGHEVTALAAFDRFLAAGDAAGHVKLFELLPRGGNSERMREGREDAGREPKVGLAGR